ncbi:MAG: glycosyltransferase [Candidatus Bathyarchaeota archaeon]|nr:glycosyltransferase [Candidatus Bathyarchaeum sp.]
MNVVIVHPSLNRGGGAEKVCLATVKALMDSGYIVKLATVEKTNWLFLEERFGALYRPSEEVYLFEYMPLRSKFSQAFFASIFFLSELIYYKIKSKHNIVVNTYGDLVDSVADVSYINALPVRIMHLYPDCGFSSGTLWQVIAHGYGLCLRLVNKFFKGNVLLTNSKFTQRVVKHKLGKESLVVFPPVNLKQFCCDTNNLDRGNIVVTVSRLRSGKNLLLIPKIAKLVTFGNFVIFGLADQASNEEIASLKKTIKTFDLGNRVILRVNQSSQALIDVLLSAKVFLHTSHMEAFGMAVVESMAAGCVPVVPKDGGPWVDVIDQKQGVFGFSYKNSKEAAQLIALLLGNTALRQQISISACKRAKIFDSSVFEKRIVDIVNRVFHEKFG